MDQKQEHVISLTSHKAQKLERQQKAQDENRLKYIHTVKL